MQLVHESETQRQHVRVLVPSSVEIEGAFYPVRDLSSGGICVQDIGKTYRRGQLLDMELTLPFEDFSLQLALQAEVEHCDGGKKVMGCRFTGLSDTRISILNFFLKSFMAGSVMSEGDLLNIVSRNNFAQRRKEENPDGGKVLAWRSVPALLLVVSGALILLFVLGNLYERAFIIKSYQGLVKSEIVIARAGSDGQFHSLLPARGAETVSKGQPLAEIHGAALAENMLRPLPVTMTLKSPCDCYLIRQYVRDGEFRSLGEPLFKLIPIEAKPWISAKILPKDAQRLDLRGKADIRIAGEESFIEGRITDIDFENDDISAAIVRVQSDKSLPMNLIGRPAYVEFLVR